MSYDYRRVMESVQTYLSGNFSALLTDTQQQREIGSKLHRRIRTCLQNRFPQALEADGEVLVDRLYEDIAGYGCLGPYLRHLNIPEYRELYEINANRWNDIVLKFQSGEVRRLSETFLSGRHAADVIHRMSDAKGAQLDPVHAYAELDIAQNVRLSVFVPPLVSEDSGTAFSIRIIRTSRTGNLYFVPQALSQAMEDFLFACIRYRIPLIIGGEPGSGKTVLLNHLLQIIGRKYRIGAIEVHSRELGGLEEKQFISLLANDQYSTDDLLLGLLRQDCDYIVPQEMRDKEAYTAMEAAITGMVLTTIHVAALRLIWGRCATLARKKVPDDHATLTQQAMDAFPIAVFMKRGDDDQFRVAEIAEGIRFDRQTNLPVYQSLFRFHTQKNMTDTGGETKIIGNFERVGVISDNLQELMRNHGAPEHLIQEFAVKG